MGKKTAKNIVQHLKILKILNNIKQKYTTLISRLQSLLTVKVPSVIQK